MLKPNFTSIAWKRQQEPLFSNCAIYSHQSGRNHQHRGHVAEVTATLGRACLWNKGHRQPKIVLYGELSTDHHHRGLSKKRYNDSLKKTLGACHIDHHQWSTLASDRQAWGLLQGQPQGETPQKEDPGSLSSHIRPDLLL